MNDDSHSKATKGKSQGSDLFFDLLSSSLGLAEQATISNLGQIDSMSMPVGWIEGQHQKRDIGRMTFREFHPPEHPAAQFCFYYRGKPVDAQSAKAFRCVMELPPHPLSESETPWLAHILRDRSRPPFVASEMKTQDLNGKRVLLVIGEYSNIAEGTCALFIDAAGDGKYVQEIYFQAPLESYLNLLPLAIESFNSIQWK